MERSHSPSETLVPLPTKRGKTIVKNFRVVLIGKTGEGKSATGNTILGRRAFEAKSYAKSQTAHCKAERCIIDGRRFLIVDTPGIFDTNRSKEEIKEGILKFFGITSPGPHVILYVVKMGRYTDEQRDAYNYVKGMLGNHSDTHTIVVFTNRDDVEADGGTVEEFMNHKTPPLARLISSVGCRYVAFNNRAVREERELQVNTLIKMIEDLVEVNHGACYTSPVYHGAEDALLQTVKYKIDPILMKTSKEVHKLQNEVALKKDIIETLKRTAKASKLRVDQAAEELRKITFVNKEKVEKIQDECESKLEQIRDDLRDDIASDKVSVQGEWFTSRLTNVAGMDLKDIIQA